MRHNYTLKQLLSMTKKQLINLGGYRNAKHMLKDKVYTDYYGNAYLPSRKQLAKDLA